MKNPQPNLVAVLFACLTLVAAAAWAQAPALEDNMCVMCHGESALWEEDTKHLFVTADDLSTDIHWQKGIRCQDCHGGNATATELRAAHATEDGFRKVASPADLPDFCGHCHSDKPYMQKFQPDADVKLVSDFWGSVHGSYLKANPADSRAASCVSCHPQHKMRANGDPQSAVHASHLLETCGTCHQAQRDGLLTGVHKEAEDGGKGEKSPLDCRQCHTGDVHGMRPVQDMGAPVFVNHQTRSCGRCHEKPLEEYLVSVHGHGLEHAGLLSTAVCASCHGAHEILPASDARSRLHPSRVAETCGACHRYIEERLALSVHGRGSGPGGGVETPAPGGKVQRKASCTDCHQGHDLPDPRSLGSRNQQPDRCGRCHAELTSRYRLSMHGELTDLGYGAGAKCSDCHGAHEILPVSDPNSTVASAHRLATCGKCHPQMAANLLTFDPHADHRDRARSPGLYWIYYGLLAFVLTVFGVFGVHSLFWFGRSLVDVCRQGRPRQLVPGAAAYVRFRPFHRLSHSVMMISFLGLALTGLPLKYSHHEWAQRLAYFLGGFDSTGLWHRLFSLTTFACFAAYGVYLLGRFRSGRKQGKSPIQAAFSPDSPLPNGRDFRDAFHMFRWFVGLGPKPTFERWAYWEKFDFWGACSDVFLIGTSGLILWFPDFFCSFLPGETVNVAKVIHSTLALLATGFVFSIHFFGTHVRPEKFPMDMSVLTGLVSEEELRHERPEYLERLRLEGRLDELRAVGPSRRSLRLTALAGLIALAVGLGLLGGIVWAALT